MLPNCIRQINQAEKEMGKPPPTKSLPLYIIDLIEDRLGFFVRNEIHCHEILKEVWVANFRGQKLIKMIKGKMFRKISTETYNYVS